ncbi:MAG: hypothetical protein KDC84_08245, partial [Crocinitomicaceae bacterium]|nr:hypothetical protein [Crocinitomicaceae bacterium]
EVINEKHDFYQKIHLNPHVKKPEWITDSISIAVSPDWGKEEVIFRYVYDGHRRVFYKPLELSINKPSEPTL